MIVATRRVGYRTESLKSGELKESWQGGIFKQTDIRFFPFFCLIFRYPATSPQTAHTYRDSGIPILGEFRGEDITLVLPATQDITTRDIKWISVWCRDYTIDFGHAVIASDADVPRQ